MKRINITVKVDLLPGTAIEAAAHELCQLANRIGVFVEAGFNGVTLIAAPGDNPEKLANAWQREMNSDHAFKFARGI